MGVYTTAIQPDTNHRYQFKTGWIDGCATYQVGDKVEHIPDGVFDGLREESGEGGYAIVVIKDSTLMEVMEVDFEKIDHFRASFGAYYYINGLIIEKADEYDVEAYL